MPGHTKLSPGRPGQKLTNEQLKDWMFSQLQPKASWDYRCEAWVDSADGGPRRNCNAVATTCCGLMYYCMEHNVIPWKVADPEGYRRVRDYTIKMDHTSKMIWRNLTGQEFPDGDEV